MASIDAPCASGKTQSPDHTTKADLREMMSKHPLPAIDPDTVRTAVSSVNSEEPSRQAQLAIDELNASLSADDAERLQSCFLPQQAYWRDQLALTYHLRTFSIASNIAASLLETKKLRCLTGGFQLNGKAQLVPVAPTIFIDCTISFKTNSPPASCSGRMLLLPILPQGQRNPGRTLAWKIWILSTKLDNFDQFPEDENLLYSPRRNLNNAPELLETDALIVGCGNAAVSLAARLKALGVESIMLDRNPHVGDSWAKRYDCLRFHVPTSFCEMPYLGFAKELQSPHLLTRDDLTEHLRRYVKAFHLNVINSAEIASTTQLEDKRWRVDFNTSHGPRTAIAKHLVQATGIGSQKPYLPPVAEREVYKGIDIHSAQYKNATALKDQGVRSVLIVGSANTAFDVLEDCHAAGLQTTMVARSPTYIVPIEYINKVFAPYHQIGVDATDNLFMTLPTVVDSHLAKGLLASFAEQEPERYKALAESGFPFLNGTHPDACLPHNLLERAGGHYVDIGGTSLLALGQAKVKAGVEPIAYTTAGLRFSDSSTADADAVIWCTGFADKDAGDTTADILKAKEKLPADSTWGIDEEGEIRGMWKRHLRAEKFWIMGGHTQQHRWYSRILALQIKAALEGILPDAFRDTPEL